MKRTNMHIKHFILIALLCAPSLCLYLSFFGHVTPIEIYNCQQLVDHIHTSIDCDQTVCINNFNTDQTQETWITVFVHGIMSIKKHVSLPNIIRLMKDETENTTYAQAVKIMRENPFFFENQAMQQLGLEKIYPTRRERGYASGALASLFDSVVKKSNSTINNHFYTFGWSGLISERSRKSAGEELYHALADEVEKLTKDVEDAQQVFDDFSFSTLEEFEDLLSEIDRLNKEYKGLISKYYNKDRGLQAILQAILQAVVILQTPIGGGGG